MPEPLYELTRGPVVECMHRGDLAVTDAQGRLLAWIGNPNKNSYLRSAAKPLQALQILLSGAADRYGLTDEQLAVACASHYGEAFHEKAVLGIFQKIGLEPQHLLLAATPSLSDSWALEMARQGREPSLLTSDCSGKHAGMLAVCLHRSWPLHNYNDPEHPLQRENRRILALMAGMAEDQIQIGVDGCSVPVFAMPLRAMATAYARLGDPSGMPPEVQAAARRITRAMIRHPEMIAGTGGFCTDLIRHTHGHLVGKLGAEGVYCVGNLDRGWGLALKIEDGAIRALAPVILKVLEELGILENESLEALKDWHHPKVLNDLGWIVGEGRTVFDLKWEEQT